MIRSLFLSNELMFPWPKFYFYFIFFPKYYLANFKSIPNFFRKIVDIFAYFSLISLFLTIPIRIFIHVIYHLVALFIFLSNITKYIKGRKKK